MKNRIATILVICFTALSLQGTKETKVSTVLKEANQDITNAIKDVTRMSTDKTSTEYDRPAMPADPPDNWLTYHLLHPGPGGRGVRQFRGRVAGVRRSTRGLHRRH